MTYVVVIVDYCTENILLLIIVSSDSPVCGSLGHYQLYVYLHVTVVRYCSTFS
jgi:hypothetical protein